jgi:hypothetical protein
LFQGLGQKPPSGDHSGKTTLGIDDIEIENALLETRGADSLKSLTDTLFGQ